jgi:hypothetical protein
MKLTKPAQAMELRSLSLVFDDFSEEGDDKSCWRHKAK